MAKIHPSAIVDKKANLDDDVVVGPNCVIESGATLGAGTILDVNVVIANSAKVGKANMFSAGCVIGRGPQILGYGPSSNVGGLVIGDRNVFREGVTIHVSKYPDSTTKIGNDNFLMVAAHVGHDCIVEDKIVISNCVHIGGHCIIETGAWLAGMVGVHQFVTVGKWCFAGGFTAITRDAPPFLIISGHYPPRIRGVNKRGMLRAGLNEQQQKCVIESYRTLFRKGGVLLKNARALGQEEGLDPNVRAIVESIENSSKHRFGRYLETLRKS